MDNLAHIRVFRVIRGIQAASFTSSKRTRAMPNAKTAPPQNVALYEGTTPRDSRHRPYRSITRPAIIGDSTRLIPGTLVPDINRVGNASDTRKPIAPP